MEDSYPAVGYVWPWLLEPSCRRVRIYTSTLTAVHKYGMDQPALASIWLARSMSFCVIPPSSWVTSVNVTRL